MIMEEKFLIQDLEQRTRVSVRNIRYYTDQKLLPPPAYRGKQAYYTGEHLKRIQVIQRLRERHFSISEIRKILYQLDETGLQRLLEYQDSYHSDLDIFTNKKHSQEVNPDPQNTVAYIDYLLGRRPLPTTNAAMPMKEPPVLMQMASQPRSNSLPRAESWERIPLAPGVELHVLQPVNPADQETILLLVETARKAFKKRKKGG